MFLASKDTSKASGRLNKLADNSWVEFIQLPIFIRETFSELAEQLRATRVHLELF